MRLRNNFRASTVLPAVLAFGFSASAQSHAPDATSAARSADSPPAYINFVHERLKPGRESGYSGELSNIRDWYERFKVPAYWLELRSLTGPDEMAALNFFESFGAMEETVSGIGAGIAAHPELVGLQDRLLEENVSSVSNLIAARVDGLGFRAGTIHFAQMRLLHATVFHIRPGHEGEFAEAAQSIAAAYEKVEGSPAWVIYAVNAGAPAPSYIMLTALTLLKEEDAAAARRAPAMEAASRAVQLRWQEIAREAYSSVETNIYFVNPGLSHMPQDFTALAPDYWMPKALPVPAAKDCNR